MKIAREYQRVIASPGLFTNWVRNIGPMQRALAAAYKGMDLATVPLRPQGRLLEQARAYLVGHSIQSFTTAAGEALMATRLFSHQELDEIMSAVRKMHFTWPSNLSQLCRSNHLHIVDLINLSTGLFGIKPICEIDSSQDMDCSIILNWLKEYWQDDMLSVTREKKPGGDIAVKGLVIDFDVDTIDIINKPRMRKTLLSVQSPLLTNQLRKLGVYKALENDDWQALLKIIFNIKPATALPGITFGYPEPAVLEFLKEEKPDPGEIFMAGGRELRDFNLILDYFEDHGREHFSPLLEKGYSLDEINLVLAAEKEQASKLVIASRWLDIAIVYFESSPQIIQQAIDRFDAMAELMAYYLSFVQGLEFHLNDIIFFPSDIPPVFQMLPNGFSAKKTNIYIHIVPKRIITLKG